MLSSLALCLSAPFAALGGDFEFVTPAQRGDGTIWFHSMPVTRSAGSAQLGALDLGPIAPPQTIGGIHAVWLEWNPTHVYAHAIGGGVSSLEVTRDPPVDPTPISGCLGAATLNGGFILSMDASGILTDIRACVGSFLWTADDLHLMAIGGGIDVDEVTIGGASIPGVIGVAVLASGIFDHSTVTGVAAPAISGAALVYTPSKLYLVQCDLSAGVSYSIAEVSAAGGSIAKVRGIATACSGFDTSLFPGDVDGTGAAYVWNDGHVYLVTEGAVTGVGEVLKPAGGGPMIASLGVMPISGSDSSIPGGIFRNAALVWEEDRAWIVALEGALTVIEAELPPGSPGSGALVSTVFIPPTPSTLLVQRQASYLWESLASIRLPGGGTQRGLVIGVNQRNP